MVDRSMGRYRIRERLGMGGMGEVYRAFDTQLERELAIKFVGPRLAADPAVHERLLLEAKAASALNHPHICTIYEVGEFEGQSYIAMEYVVGQPLSQLIPDGGMAVELVLRYGSQIADAIDHAHERGIVHRDLKSSNVVIADGGRAKILDFGLARQIDEKEISTLSTTTVRLARPGAIEGTLPYLAPEILQGQPADARSDIWSLGVLLYELASGELPFAGTSGYEIGSAIQMAAPAPLPMRVPPGLRAVIQRCLSKVPSQRYQRAGEVRAALEALSSGSDLAPGAVPASLRRRIWLPVLLGVLTILVAGLGYLALRERSELTGSALPAESGRMKFLLSSTENLYDPVLSPDGNMLAYVAEENGQSDIFVRRVEGGKSVRLTDDADAERELDFSNHGDRLAFSRVRRGERPEICLVPTLGGDIVPVVSSADVPSWSPDDRQLAFLRRAPGDVVELVILTLENGETRTVLRADADTDLPFLVDLDWSPRGDKLAVIRGRGGIQRELWIVPVDGSTPYPLVRDPSRVFSDDAVFTADGKAVLYSSNRSGATNLWLQPLDGSAAVRVTSGTGPDFSPCVAGTGSVVFLNSRSRTELFDYDLQSGQARSLVRHDHFLWAPVFSPDGREIAYSRGEVDGAWHVWMVSTDGSENRQVTTGDVPQILPRFFPDGQSLIYFTWSSGKDRVWRIPREGGTARPLTPATGVDASYADVSPDGKWLVFTRTLPEGPCIQVMAIDGGEPRSLTSNPSEVPRWSPDGQWIAFSRSRDSRGGVWIVRPDGSGLRALTETGSWPTWWPDSNRVAYLVDNTQGREEYWSVDLEGGKPEHIGPRDVSTNNPFSISPDGRSLVYSDDVLVSNEIWMLQTSDLP